jgi:hypothetical protein
MFLRSPAPYIVLTLQPLVLGTDGEGCLPVLIRVVRGTYEYIINVVLYLPPSCADLPTSLSLPAEL